MQINGQIFNICTRTHTCEEKKLLRYRMYADAGKTQIITMQETSKIYSDSLFVMFQKENTH